ncbi:MAG TPA: response regulator [Candidatus Thermoplasmatota archaeon]|nr:response regulator [Candidatus Thermoplasmatota archaeon]
MGWSINQGPLRPSANPGEIIATKILIVDDEPGILLSTRLLLQALGYEVATSSQPSEAPRLLREERPDALLLDLLMPGFDPAALLRAIRADPAIRDTPVVLFSASEDLATYQARVGADAYLEKPFRPTEVKETLDRVIREAAAKSS